VAEERRRGKSSPALGVLVPAHGEWKLREEEAGRDPVGWGEEGLKSRARLPRQNPGRDGRVMKIQLQWVAVSQG
jgi:hypothetical protein